MSKDYGFNYDYSNLKPLHKFINKTNKNELLVYSESFDKFAILQKSSNGQQQRLKVDSTALSKMLSKLDSNNWEEIYG